MDAALIVVMVSRDTHKSKHVELHFKYVWFIMNHLHLNHTGFFFLNKPSLSYDCLIG